MGKPTSDEVYVATRTAHIDFEGRRQIIRKGVTRVAAGHDLLKKHPDLFKPAGDDVRFDVEDAQTRPASRDKTSRLARAAARVAADDAGDDVPYKKRKVPTLQAEISRRNEGRPESAQIVPASNRKADLVKALEQSDADLVKALYSQDPPTGGEPPSDDPPTGGEPPSEDPPSDGKPQADEQGD